MHVQFRVKPRTVVLFDTSQSGPGNNDNKEVFCSQKVLEYLLIGITLQIIVDLRVMPIKRYSTFPKPQELEPDAWAEFSIKHRKLVLFDP